MRIPVLAIALAACSASPAAPVTDATPSDGSGSATDGSATDGSAADASGDGAMAGAITILMTDGGFDSYNFGGVGVGMASNDISLTVTNTGSLATAPLVFTYHGATPADFPVDASLPDGCSGKVLAGGASCVLSVHFVPKQSTPCSAGMHANGDAAYMGLIGTGI